MIRLLVGLICVLAGCGGVNSNQTLSFTSNVEPVTVTVNGLSCGIPCTLEIPAGLDNVSVEVLIVENKSAFRENLERFLVQNLAILLKEAADGGGIYLTIIAQILNIETAELIRNINNIERLLSMIRAISGK